MSQMLTDKRASRGTRMAELVGEAAEEDEAFWNHDIWNEDGSDAESYEAEEEEKPDVFDSDFNDTETEEESGSDDDKPAKRGKPDKSQNKYKEPQKRLLTVEEMQAKAEAKSQKRLRIAVDFEEGPQGPRAVRDSTKAKTVDADIARTKKAETDKLKARSSPKMIKTQFEQRDMLLEALATEELNKKWLIAQKLEEDERIAADKPAKAAVNESFIRFASRRGACNTITFTTVDAFPQILSDLTPPEPPSNLCVVTGLKARYKDPQTGFPYHDLAAYKELRKLYPAPRRVKR